MAENFTIEANDEVENFEVDFGEVTQVSNKDFNKLENRPSYAGEVMTGETSIPEVPSAVSELTNDANYQTGAQVEAAIDAETTARESADTALDNRLTTVEGIAGTALQPEAINKVVMTDIAVGANTSTTTFNLEAAKENLLTGATSSKQVSMPVASSTEAGIMNSSTFDAVLNNTSNINALLNGAVAITGLPAEPTQAQLTTAWETATGATALMNRAGIYDVTNGKVWTYYANSSTWYSVTNTTQVTINTFTNNSEGTIKGSTNVGQIFAEADGTGSVNGWDALNDTVADNTSDISGLETAMEGKQDKLVAGANINIASDGKTISATDTTYTAGNGINISAQNVISTDAPEGFFTLPATVEGEGSEITLNNTIGAKLDEVQVDGDTKQQTYTGKNLLPVDEQTVTSNGLTYVMNSDGTITISGTSTAVSAATLTTEFSVTLVANQPYTISASNPVANGSVILRLMDENGSPFSGSPITLTNTNMSGTFTPTSDSGVLRGQVRIAENTTLTNFVIKPMLEKGSTATDFEPYVGGIPSPNPDYPQEIHTTTGEQTAITTGKNICYETEMQDSNNIRFYLKGLVSETVTLSATINVATVSNSIYLRVDGESYGVVGTLTGAANTRQSRTLGLSSAQIEAINNGNEAYLLLYKSNAGFTLPTDAQVENGSTLTPYQPYQSQTYTISLGSTELCKIGDYQDYIYKGADGWYLHKEIGKALGNAVEWGNNGTNTNFTQGLIKGLDVGTSINVNDFVYMYRANILASGDDARYQTISPSTTYRIFGTNSSRWIIVNIGVDYAPNWATFQTIVQGLVLYYALATPTDTKITDATLVGQLEALWNAMSYNEQTNVVVTASDNGALPAILEINAYQKSLNGLLGAIERVNG